MRLPWLNSTACRLLESCRHKMVSSSSQLHRPYALLPCLAAPCLYGMRQVEVLRFSKHLLRERRILEFAQCVLTCHCAYAAGQAAIAAAEARRAAMSTEGRGQPTGSMGAALQRAMSRTAVIWAGGRCGGQGHCPGARQAPRPLPHDSPSQCVPHGGANFHW